MVVSTGAMDSRRAGTAARVAAGALVGLTWAAALRAFMVEIAGASSSFAWWGTFGAILFPGALVGGLLAWGWCRRRRGHASALFLLSPLLLALVPLAEPGAIGQLFASALGGGAIGVALTLVGGGFALGDRGPLWVRIVVGTVTAALLVGFALTGVLVVGDRLHPLTPRGAWLIVLVLGLMVVAILATAAAGGRGSRREPGPPPT